MIRVYVARKILTMNPAQPVATHVAVCDGRILAVGDLQDMRRWTDAAPILTGAAPVADPLPQALVLTAIVIGFATTGFIIELALRSRHETGTDHVVGEEAQQHASAREGTAP